MKVTVNKYLNARIGKASTDAACQFYKSPADTIEIDDVLVGTEIDGNSIWYHCKDDGCYYWSGGIEEEEFEAIEKQDFSPQLIDCILNDFKRNQFINFKNRYPDLTGIYIGNKKKEGNIIEGNYLVFQFLQKTDVIELETQKIIPKWLIYKGLKIETDIIESPKAFFNWDYIGVSAPRKIGGTISTYKSSNAGTIAFVAESNSSPNKKIAVTNYHVIAEDLILNEMTSYDNPNGLIQVVMPAWSCSQNDKNIQGRLVKGLFNQFHDTAFIELDRVDSVINNVNDDLKIDGFLDIFRQSIYKGKTVRIYGAMSGMKEGEITSVDANRDFTSQDGRINNSMIELLQFKKISVNGDSGSAVFLDGKIVGIIVGSDDLNSYAIPIDKIIFFGNLKDKI